MKWTLILSYFRSLSLAHLERSLYSLSRQTVQPDELLFFDNNSPEAEFDLRCTIGRHYSVKDWALYFMKHGDNTKTLAWGNNRAIQLANTETYIFARADFIYAFDYCERVLAAHEAAGPLSLAASWHWGMPYYSGATHATVDHGQDLEPLNWREDPQRLTQNRQGARPEHNVHIDSPTHCTSKAAMAAGGWYDETLHGWGYDHSSLQIAMARSGVQFRIIPEYLLFHMEHDCGQEAWDAREHDRARAQWCASPRRSEAEAEWMRQHLKLETNPEP